MVRSSFSNMNSNHDKEHHPHTEYFLSSGEKDRLMLVLTVKSYVRVVSTLRYLENTS